MQKLFSKIDWVLVPRLIMSSIMCIVGYQTNDYIAGVFGLFFAGYSIFGAKYKVGCGYNGCGYTPRSAQKKDQNVSIEFKELK